MKFKIVNTDMGIGILKIDEGYSYQKIEKISKQTFDDYLIYKKNLPIISIEEGLDFIDE